MGEDHHIPPKLIKTAGGFLAELLSNIINCCFNTSTCPGRGNGGTGIHVSTNYRPIWWSTGAIVENKNQKIK